MVQSRRRKRERLERLTKLGLKSDWVIEEDDRLTREVRDGDWEARSSPEMEDGLGWVELRSG